MKLKIKKGDTVEVITGSDKGKKGAVLTISTVKSIKVKVQGVRMQTHFTKEGLVKKEGFLDYSNVKLVVVAAKSKKATPKKKAVAKK